MSVEPSPEELAAIRNEQDYDAEPPKPEKRASKKIVHLPDIHRVLPSSSEAEQGILGSCMLLPKDCIPFATERGVTPEWFHIPAHGTIYGAIIHLFDRDGNVDAITLTNHLRDKGTLDQVGGVSFVTSIQLFVPTAAGLGQYIEIVDEKRQLREAISHCTDIAARCYDGQDEADAIMEDLEKGSMQIRSSRFGKVKERTAKELVMEAVGSIQDLYERRGQITGIPTGFTELDKATNGLTNDRVIIIAARPSVGKTALAMNIAEHIAVDLKKHVAVFSLEMSAQQLMQRLLCSRAKVNLQKVRDGLLSERDFPALTAAASKIAEAKIHIDDFSEATIQYIRAKARRLKAKLPEGFVAVVDYLQLVGSASKKSGNREGEVAEVSRGLKLMSRELGIPVIALCQLNRAMEKEKRKPRLSDLRESGSIEQDADDVWFIHRDDVGIDPDDEEAKAACEGRASLIIAKQRNGERDISIPLTFLKEYTRFETRYVTEEEQEERRQKFSGKGKRPFRPHPKSSKREEEPEGALFGE